MKRVSPTDLDEEVEGSCFRASPFDWRIDIEESMNNPVVTSVDSGAPIEIDVDENIEKRIDSNDGGSDKEAPAARSSRRKKKPKGLPKRFVVYGRIPARKRPETVTSVRLTQCCLLLFLLQDL